MITGCIQPSREATWNGKSEPKGPEKKETARTVEVTAILGMFNGSPY